jgi:glycosidase
MEGKRERLPVQRIKPLTDEPADETLRDAYARLLTVTRDDVFQNGEFSLFDPNLYGAMGFTRRNQNRVIAYIAQVSDAWHRFNAPPMNVSAIAHEVGASSKLTLTNLLTSQGATIEANDGAFHMEMSRLGVDDETRFCLVEASPA